MRLQCLLLALLVVLFPLVTAARGPSSADPIEGGWEHIKDISDPHVQEIAKWAVSEYNLKNHKGLVFQKVVEGQIQVVAGMNYKLLISVENESSIVNYEGFVYERPWKKVRQLVSFTKK